MEEEILLTEGNQALLTRIDRTTDAEPYCGYLGNIINCHYPATNAMEDATGIEISGDYPKANSAALKYLASKISRYHEESFLFSDTMVMLSNGKYSGESNVSVELTTRRGEECYLVHVSSKGAVDGIQMGTTITGYVSLSMETLEQQTVEYIKIPNKPIDRRAFLTLHGDEYILRKFVAIGDAIERKTYIIPHDLMKGFISEAASILIQRQFVQNDELEDIIGLQFITLNADCRLCHLTYMKLHEKEDTINSNTVQLKGITKTLTVENERPISWNVYFFPDGHMFSREQVGSTIVIKVNIQPTPVLLPKERKLLEYKWQDDMQFYSQYLDRKEELEAQRMTYLGRHPEIKAILADFLQFLLLKKPDDPCAFASEFFSTYLPPELPS
ncbi:Ciliogenesis-associated TTC17-interacting protein [Trichoplax sp. H2]|nr:Ciliogenesis-associated TTC17-interacting protein [Trichoplax sp. H2]|eukprot:RDD40202.1 Ciliogenesis-associated TTC17-interacting protein [Trichoplax sp. H2]